MKTSISFRDRVKVQLRRARDGMLFKGGKMTGNLIFTHNEVADILEDLDELQHRERVDELAKKAEGISSHADFVEFIRSLTPEERAKAGLV